MSEFGAEENFIGDEEAIADLARRAGLVSPRGVAEPDRRRVILVLDESAGRVLCASAAALPLRKGVAGADGRLSSSLRIGEQIGRARPGADRPVIARIQFDPRRIAPPSTCLIARAALSDGARVLVLSIADPPPRLRALPVATEPARGAAPAPPSSEPQPPEEPASGGPAPPAGGPPRFTWRSDEGGTITQVSGLIAEGARAAMIERSWAALSEAGILLDAQGVLAALAAQRTFRAIAVSLRAGGSAPLVEIELSGAPLGRGGHGFAGFGLVRPAREAPPLDAPALFVPAVGHAAADAPPDPGPSLPSEIADAPIPASAGAGLSSNEHDAFREIARALGARFAGDDAPDPEAPLSEEAPGPHAQTGSVTPFPGRAVEAAADPAVAATLEHLPSGALVYRGNAALFANRRLLDLSGYADLAAIDAAGGISRLFHGLPPHERPSPDAPVALAAWDGRSLPVDLQHSGMEWRGARAELVLVRPAPAFDPAGELAALRMAKDVAGQSAEDALAILESLDDGVATLDAGGRVLTLNRSAAAAFGLDPREVVGGGFAGLFAPEGAMEVLAAVHGAAAGAREATARARNGHAPLRLTVSPLRPGGDGADGTLAVLIRDLAGARHAETESAIARHAAEAASAQKSDFLATISHEIRTPMNSILGFADVMLAESFGPIGVERYRGYLRDIHASGSHVLSLVNDLLDLAKIEAGRLDLAFTDVPLNDLVSGCVAMMQPQAARERIVVRTSFSADLTTLLADERSVRQAALNVIANAIQFTAAGGQVIVSTTIAERGEIALRVRDTGIGMTPDEVETALEPFRQITVAGARKGGGTGLGLPLTKALVEANHGRFRITSRKDEGTLVEMLFPAPVALSA